MDDIVLRAMQKWPSVPQVFGWLRLDRRGQWLVKNASGGHERIRNTALVEFINRNYDRDERGRWFFQNGPQRVFVALDYTPWVCRLDDRADALVTHTGRTMGPLELLLLDEAGAMLVVAQPGVAVIDDRDLAALMERLGAENASSAGIESVLERPLVGLFGRPVPLAGIRAEDVPGRFAFDPRPVPPAGMPECS
ncbi:MAG: hypothetical protein A3G27_05175 [Betaproteobacteria bacterium RIFCSPLOWO2_12_FULL_66_14]|nr:MAG: hypothetical protein A3G27_05175 [Betaproteobacteria bacterium RIFCSPLOWO2_12_FULL_66_14]